jgi:hypothetical protein
MLQWGLPVLFTVKAIALQHKYMYKININVVAAVILQRNLQLLYIYGLLVHFSVAYMLNMLQLCSEKIVWQ